MGGGGICLSAQFMTKQKEYKLKMNEGKRKVYVTFIKQFVRCDCTAVHWRGAGFQQLLGDHLHFHCDFIQTVIALPCT